MQIDPYILAFSALTVIATIWMGFRSARTSKTTSDFFVAGRSVSVGWNASAISGEYLSAASFMGVAGMVMSSGYDALWYPVCYACGYLFLLLFIAGPLRRFGAYTIPDFAEGRFDSPMFRKIAVVFVLFIGFFYTMPQMKGAGTTLAYIFPGLPYWAGVVLVGAVITLNVALGGMKGITLVQAFQYWAKMFAISVPIFVLMAVYGHYGKHLEANSAAPVPGSGASTQEVQRALSAEIDKLTANMRITLDGGGRKPLPDRAPRDETWLNPFGPLTTKAAKNAAAAIGRRANPRAADFIPIASPDAASQARSATLKSGATKIDSPLPAGSLMNIDRALARITGAFGVHAFRTADVPTTISGAASPNPLGHETGLAFVKQTLALSGVALLEKGNSVYAVPAGRADFYEARLQDAQNPIPLRADLPPEQRMTVNLDSPTVSQALTVYAELTGRHLVPTTNSMAERVDDLIGGKLSQLKLLSRTPLPDSGVRIHADGAFTALDVKAAIEAHLKTNGLALVAAGDKSFRVEKVSQSVSESLSQKTRAGAPLTHSPTDSLTHSPEQAWLDKHEKPLALLYTYSLIIALVCGTAGLPHILVRFYTNPDGTAAKKTTMWVMILIGVFYLFPPIFGVMGRNLLPSLYAGTGAKGTDKVVLELPRILNSDPVTHSPTDSLRGGVSQSVGKSVSQKNPIPWGSILSGIACAGAFAAFMSTFSGLLVSMTGALAHDVYGRILRPKATPEQRLRMFKISAVLIGSVAILLGSFVEPLQINFMVGQAFAIAAASYFPLLFMSVWWRGMTMKGAAAGMLTGGICALAAVTITNFSDLKWIDLADFWAANPLLRILCEQPAIWTVPLAIGLMVVVSKLTKREVPADSRMKMLVLHAPEKLGLKQEYIQEHQAGH